MKDILSFAVNHPAFSIVMAGMNFLLGYWLVLKLSLYASKNLSEAVAGRNQKQSVYGKITRSMGKSFKEYERKNSGKGFYIKAKEKLLKSGYNGEHAVTIYFILKYICPVILFALLFIRYYPDFFPALAAAPLVLLVVEYVVYRRKREQSLKFNRYIYKIYKYLHNQINSGIKPTDAIKTVYMVIEDQGLKEILIQLAARYELTLNIDEALSEFKLNFDLVEAETLCVALKQGVETGDSQELLSRQEQFMFNKYFNYIQAETDSCKLRGTISVFIFAFIMVILISVPLFKDVADATGKIFLN